MQYLPANVKRAKVYEKGGVKKAFVILDDVLADKDELAIRWSRPKGSWQATEYINKNKVKIEG